MAFLLTKADKFLENYQNLYVILYKVEYYLFLSEKVITLLRFSNSTNW